MSDLKYTLRTKVDLATHSAIDELANHCKNGNISALLRKIVIDYVADQKPSEGMSIDLRWELHERSRRKRQEVKEALASKWVELQKDPDPVGETLAIERAKEHGLPWPPVDVRAATADPDLRAVVERLDLL